MINCIHACTDTNMHTKAFVDYPLTSPPTPLPPPHPLLTMNVSRHTKSESMVRVHPGTEEHLIRMCGIKLGINTAHSDHIWLCLKYHTRNMELQGQSYVGRMHYKNKTRKHLYRIDLHPCLLKIIHNHLPLSPTDTFVVFYKRNSKTAL